MAKKYLVAVKLCDGTNDILEFTTKQSRQDFIEHIEQVHYHDYIAGYATSEVEENVEL
jgi:hypothetical protein